MVPVAVYAAPGDLCFEDIDDMCGLLSKDPEQLFGSFMVPLESQAEGFSVVILWGGLLAIVWLVRLRGYQTARYEVSTRTI